MSRKDGAGKIAGALLALFLLWPAALQAAEKRALLIGINDYLANDPGAQPPVGDTWVPEDLNGALNDIALMRQVLKSRYGFADKNIRTLENSAATRTAMLAALEDFVAQTRPGDIVYIHFSGHGSQVPDTDGDEEDGLDETILSHDARTGNVPDITDDELGRLLAGLRTPNSLVVLDSCHSGTATRGSSALKARSVPQDRREDLYVSSGDTGSDETGNYLLMTGAADYQSALDGPIDEGRYYGLFTLSLGRTIGRMPPGASAQVLHQETRREMERIGEQFGLFAVPDAQLEAAGERRQQGILGEAAVNLARRDAARLAWVPVQAAADGQARLEGAGAMATRPGAVWAVYPPGEARFEPGTAAATATIARVESGDAIAHLEAGAAFEPGSRAVPLAPAPPDTRVPVRLDRMSEEDRAAIGAALRLTPGGGDIELVGKESFARFLVDREGGHFTAYGADGLQKVADLPGTEDSRAIGEALVALARRSRHVNDVLALDNPSSDMHLAVRVNPVDPSGAVRGVAVVGAADVSAYRVRQPGQARDRSNSLMLDIEVGQDSYLTVVDVDSQGTVAILFPNPVSERRGFLPDGFVRGGNTRIPDALQNNRAGFYWDYAPPAGIDTLRVFAASDLESARRIRAYLAGISGAVQQRGVSSPGTGRLDLYLPRPALGTRGVAVVEEPGAPRPDWTAASVTVVVEE